MRKVQSLTVEDDTELCVHKPDKPAAAGAGVYRPVAESALDWIWIVSPERRLTFSNSAVRSLLGYDTQEVLGKDFLPLIHGDDSDLIRRMFQIAVRQKRGWTDMSAKWLHKDGSVRFFESKAQAILNNRGDLLGFTGVDRDVTERRNSEAEIRNAHRELEKLVGQRTEELIRAHGRLEQEIAERRRAEARIQASLKEKELLLKELHHRVKNNLQLISSLLSLQANHVTDPRSRELFRVNRNRVRSMAMIHERIYRSADLAGVDFARHVRGTVRDLAQCYGTRSDRVELCVDIEDVSLGVDMAIPCGMVINELVTNALKHAFPDGRPGRICVRFKSAGDHFELTVADDGCGMGQAVDAPRPGSLGLELVRTLTDQLSGQVTVRNDDGTAMTITFPKKR